MVPSGACFCCLVRHRCCAGRWSICGATSARARNAARAWPARAALLDRPDQPGPGCNSRVALPAADPPDHRSTDHDLHPDARKAATGQERNTMITLNTYRQEWFGTIRADLLSGLVVALALIPEAIAFSIIAGVDPKVGLYASFSIAVISAFTGGRPGMISAATAATAVLMVTLVKDHGLQYLLAATILAGAFAIAAGLAIIYLFPYVTKAIPPPLVTIVVLTALTLYFGWDVRTVSDMGQLPDTLPVFLIPQIPFTLETLQIILPYSLAVAAVGLLESLMTQNLIDEITETITDRKQECIGQGLSNFFTGFIGGMAGCAMIGQSMINIK